MSEFFLHLELDNSGIKARIIEQDYKHTIIKDTFTVLFNDMPDVKQGGEEEDLDLFNRGVDIIAKELDLTSCSKATIFISDRLISFRNLELPFNSEKKIRQILPFELETHLPYNNEPCITDFHMLGFTNSSDESKLILSASITQSLVEKYFLKLDEYDITPSMITPIGYAAAIGFLSMTLKLNELKSLSTFAFLYACDSEITLILIKEKKPCAVRTIANYNISSDRLAVFVEQTIIGFNLRTGEKNYFDVVVGMDENIHNGNQISNAFVIKPGTNLGNRAQSGMKFDSNVLLSHISSEKPAQYLFNFCKGKYGTNSFFKTYLPNIAVSAVLLLFAFVLLLISVGLDNKNLKSQISDIDNQARLIFKTSFPGKTKIHDPYLQMQANVKSFMKNSNAKKKPGSLTGLDNLKIVQIIGELSQKIDDSIDIDISRFLFNKEQLVVSGSTDNFNNVDKIKSKIESSQIFKTVNISSAAADKKGNRVKFKFIIEM
jgi:general secretion pathway protein L